MYCFIIVGLVASAAVHGHGSSYCPDVKPVENFNLAAYGNGKWYEIARVHVDAEKGGNCGAAEYKLDGLTIKIKNTDVANKRLRTIEGYGKLASDAGNTGKLVYTLPYGENGALSDNTLWVLATDYDNYAVVYYCKPLENKKSHEDFVWVFSRTKKLEGEAKAAVDKVINSSKFIDSAKLMWPDFSDEACKYWAISNEL